MNDMEKRIRRVHPITFYKNEVEKLNIDSAGRIMNMLNLFCEVLKEFFCINGNRFLNNEYKRTLLSC